MYIFFFYDCKGKTFYLLCGIWLYVFLFLDLDVEKFDYWRFCRSLGFDIYSFFSSCFFIYLLSSDCFFFLLFLNYID